MTITLVPFDDDRPTLRVATLSSRHGTGKVVYPPEFARLAHPASAALPVTPRAAREGDRSASSPLSPIERIACWYMAHEWVASVIVGLFIVGAAATFAAWIVG